MGATVASPPMPKKKPSEKPEEEPKVTTIKIAPDLHHKANMVARHRSQKLHQYTDGLLRPLIERDYKEMGEEVAADN